MGNPDGEHGGDRVFENLTPYFLVREGAQVSILDLPTDIIESIVRPDSLHSPAKAHDRLASHYARLTEGLERRPAREAKAGLGELAARLDAEPTAS